MDLYSVFANPALLRSFASLAVLLVLSGVGALAVKYGFAKPFAQAVEWYIRNFKSIREKVDEPTDDINVQLEMATGIPKEVWSSVLPTIIDAIRSGAEALPLPEREIPSA